MFGGNFMTVEFSIRSESEQRKDMISEVEMEREETGSFIDVAFGDSRNTFAGCHRFEVLRLGRNENLEEVKLREEVDESEVSIVYSSFACNPRVGEAKFPQWLHGFHLLYARLLFWDGIKEVLR